MIVYLTILLIGGYLGFYLGLTYGKELKEAEYSRKFHEAKLMLKAKKVLEKKDA